MAKPRLLLVVRGDHNDADYITQITETTQEEVDKFVPLIAAIKKFKSYKGQSDPNHHPGSKLEWSHNHNWPCGEYGCREDLGEKTLAALYSGISEDIVQEFDENYVPHAEGWNLHTIHEIYTATYQKQIFSTGRG